MSSGDLYHSELLPSYIILLIETDDQSHQMAFDKCAIPFFPDGITDRTSYLYKDYWNFDSMFSNEIAVETAVNIIIF